MAIPPENSNQENSSENLEQQVDFAKNSFTALEKLSSDIKDYIYSASEFGKLRQGEILSNVIQVKLRVESLGTGNIEAAQIVHPFALILSQDCDCEQDFDSRQQGSQSDKIIPNILLCEIVTAEELRGAKDINSTIWSQIKINKNERYQFLEKVPSEVDALKKGLPELGIDFKRYFTIPTDELYYRLRIDEAQKRCRLLSPYMEHLCSRFSNFLSRIALPNDHASEKGL